MKEIELRRSLVVLQNSSSDHNDAVVVGNITSNDVLISTTNLSNSTTTTSSSILLPVTTVVEEGREKDNDQHVVPGSYYDTSSEEEDYTSDDDDDDDMVLVAVIEKDTTTKTTTTKTTKAPFRVNNNNNDNNNDDDDVAQKHHQYMYSKTTCNSSSSSTDSSTDEKEEDDKDNDDDDDDVNETSAKELFPNDNDAQARIQEAKDLLFESSSLSSLSLLSSKNVVDVTTTTTTTTNTMNKKENNNNKNDVDEYISRRIMTSTQERWNGLSILPSTIFCLWYCFSGSWWKWNYQRLLLHQEENGSSTTATNDVFTSCFVGASSEQTSLSYMLPPIPLLSIVLGIVLHAPFSFIHHYYYCVILPPGQQRFNHWSRQYDQGFIHVASAFISYGTSGNISYFILNSIFAIYSFYKLLIAKKATPIPNQLRILISMILYTCPVLFVQNNITLFIEVWLILLISIYIFATYPMKGWSHCAFHLIIAFVPPMLMYSSTNLSQCKDIILRAAAAASSTSEQQCLELL